MVVNIMHSTHIEDTICFVSAKQMITTTVVSIENQLNGLSYGLANALFAVVSKLRRRRRRH